MTKSNTSNLEPFDPETKWTFRRLRNLVKDNLSPRKQVKMDETPTPVGVEATGRVVEAQNHRRTLMKYAQPSLDWTALCIKRPTMQANNFELKPSYVQMIQNSVQFHGLPSEDPNLHIASFFEIYDMFGVNGVTDDELD